MEETRSRIKPEKSSFRDNHGRVFEIGNEIYRTIDVSYQKEYDHLMTSGLYDKLVGSGYLIPHQEVTDQNILQQFPGAYKVIKPEKVWFVSYPTEWCLSQFRDAALVTLKAQRLALEFGMSLKDSSAFNTQLHKGSFVLIDTLSFEFYEAGSPWVAYKQFCEHFLGPLYIMESVDLRLINLFGVTGIPVALTSKLLPSFKKLSIPVLFHIVLHAKAQTKYNSRKVAVNNRSLFTADYLKKLTDSLIGAVENISYKNKTTWGDYYQKDVSEKYFESKREVVSRMIENSRPSTLWDVGANTGEFSKLAAERGILTLSIDSDFSSIEQNYKWVQSTSNTFLYPFLVDFVNPTSSFGWASEERSAFLARSRPDTMLMLAVVHHLVISHGIPLEKIARLASTLCRDLIIEFIPKDDPMVIRLLQNRVDVFSEYNEQTFEAIFSRFFRLIERTPIAHSKRIMYHFSKDPS